MTTNPQVQPSAAQSIIEAALLLGKPEHEVTLTIMLNSDTILGLAVIANRRKITFEKALEYLLYQSPAGGEIHQVLCDEIDGHPQRGL